MLNSDFIKTWHEWLRRPIPTTNFRNGRTDSPAYAIELELDHCVSYVHGLVANFIDGKEYDYKSLAAQELAELEELRAKVNANELNDDEKEEYLSHLSETTLILKEVERSTEQSS